MPRLQQNQRTFAFSKKQKAWVTRYGFEPTCYANCGDIMLSSKDQAKVWRHDATEERNNFYGDQSYSSLEVSFNDLPSDIKIFNSVSVETNSENITAVFNTRDELNVQVDQQAPFGEVAATYPYRDFLIAEEAEQFTDKEGFKYVSVPRIGITSTLVHGRGDGDLNIIYMGSLSIDNSLIESSFVEEQTEAVEFKVRLSKSSGAAVPVGRYNQSGFPSFFEGPTLLIADGDGFKECAFNVETGEDAIIDHNTGNFFGSGLNSNLNSLFVVAQEGDIITLRYERRHFPDYGESVPPFVPFEIFFSPPFNSFLNGEALLFVETPPAINGEQLRSSYMRTSFAFQGSDYIEINAVNAEYDISTYHHSLTQNS